MEETKEMKTEERKENQTDVKKYIVDKKFKETVLYLIKDKQLSLVESVYNLMKEEREEYSENELDLIVRILSSFPYIEVFQFFDALRDPNLNLIKEVK